MIVYTDGRTWWTGNPRNATEAFSVKQTGAKTWQVTPCKP